METKKQNTLLIWVLEMGAVFGPLIVALCFTGLLAYLGWRLIAWLQTFVFYLN